MTNWQMFSKAGNDACEKALQQVKDGYVVAGVRNYNTLLGFARPFLAKVAKRHPEFWDTEPRSVFGGKLIEICNAEGWVADEDAAYYLYEMD